MSATSLRSHAEGGLDREGGDVRVLRMGVCVVEGGSFHASILASESSTEKMREQQKEEEKKKRGKEWALVPEKREILESSIK